MVMRELFYDFDKPPDENGTFWCEQSDPPVEVGQTVMFGSDETTLRQGKIVEVRGNMVGVDASPLGTLSF